MSFLDVIINNLPGVAAPLQKKLSFKEKLKWTLIILVLFFILGLVPLFGLGQNELQRFELLSIILGASFGSIISLGIGPIVTASIVLQLLNGSGIIKFDLGSTHGKSRFQGVQKLLAIFFILFEGVIYVFMGGLSPAQELIGTTIFFQLQLLLIFQLFLGGILILFMDEIVTKWGFGSGVSLFIAAGVSQSVFIRALSPLKAEGQAYIGAVPSMIHALVNQLPTEAVLSASSVLATIVVFVVAIYAQALKVEIPLSFGRVAGHGVRWPLHFIYTSNIPVILVSALFANFQLWGSLLQKWATNSGSTVLIKFSELFGTFSANGTPNGGLVAMLTPVNIIEVTITQGFVDGFLRVLPQAAIYIFFMVVGCVIFSWLWVQTSSMDAKSVAKQILNAGLIMPGFRRDTRILEHLLARKISPLTVLGAITIGFLAALADLSGALTSGTGLLLTVMIIYRLYEDIAKQHMVDMNPMLKKFMGK